MKPFIRFTSLAVTALALAACSSTSSTPASLGETTRSTIYKEGVPGGVLVETTKLKATVVAIDKTERTVTLAVEDGRQKSIKCGPEVINFDQIHIGDHVKATITSELAMALADSGTCRLIPVCSRWPCAQRVPSPAAS